MYEFPMFIDGRDVEGDGWTYVLRASAVIDDMRPTFNLKRSLELGRHSGPIPDSVVGRCAWGKGDLCATALEAARRASVEFGRTLLKDRAEIIRRVHRSLIAELDTLIELLVVEGHPRRLAEWELSGLIRHSDDDTLDWYLSQFSASYGTNGTRVQLVRKPDGVVCVNPPQNASGSNGALGVLALLAGNALVVKAPRTSPLTVTYFYRNIVQPALDAVGAPPGTLNIVNGQSRDVLQGWLDSPHVDDVLFFGASDVGLKFGADCVAANKKPVLELSGNDGFVVWKDADLKAAAKALSECFYGSAQICMVPKYALVHPDVAEEFLRELLAVTADITPGYPEEPHTLLSPVLKAHQFHDYLAEALSSGATVLCGGNRVGVDGTRQDAGLFFEPTVVRVDGLARARELSCVTEETFFPLLPVVVADRDAGSEDDLLDSLIGFLNGNKYGLRNSVWTSSSTVADRFAQAVVNGGQLKINASHIGFHSILATHGGTGDTGGPFGELNYVALRTSHLQGIVWGTGALEPIDGVVTGAPAGNGSIAEDVDI